MIASSAERGRTCSWGNPAMIDSKAARGTTGSRADTEMT
jgi:hypothetical protein